MNKTGHYHLAFRQGSIDRKDADLYIRLLSEETLDYITSSSFDKRLLRPVMRMAWRTMEKQKTPQDFDEIVNAILSDKKEMFVLMNTFCL